MVRLSLYKGFPLGGSLSPKVTDVEAHLLQQPIRRLFYAFSCT